MRKRPRTWQLIVIAAAAVSLSALVFLEWRSSWAFRDADAAKAAIAELGPGFENVRVVVSTVPRADVWGTVDSEATRARLMRRLDELDPAVRRRLSVGVVVMPAVATQKKESVTEESNP